MPEIFKTTVLGVGPFCIEFEDDGEIVYCRTEPRARLIAKAPEMLIFIQLAERFFRLSEVKDLDSGIWQEWRERARALLEEIEG